MQLPKHVAPATSSLSLPNIPTFSYGGEYNVVVRAVVRLVGHLMLVLVRYEKGKLICTHCYVITSYKLSRYVI